MKPSHPLRAAGRKIVGLLPGPIASAVRAAKRAILNRRGAATVFREIYTANGWDGTESVSGPGSSMGASANVRAALPELLRELEVSTLLDVPCGDAFWISTCLPKSVAYVGGDIVAEIVERNRRDHSALGRFEVLDLISDDLPPADLALVRDCLIHLPNRAVQQVIANLRRSKIRYLLTTTFPTVEENIDIQFGGFRPINLRREPFNLPDPVRLIAESEGRGKHLGLWRISDF